MSEASPQSPPKRFVYLGTPDAAVAPLRALVAHGFEPVLVVSRADTRRRRRGDPEPSPVKAAALELGIAVTDQVDDVCSVEADIGVVVAFGQILRDNVLAAMPMVNLHFSLLPRWRGAAPVERAILAGDPVTGVCVMEMVAALDAGAVYTREEVPIDGQVTAEELRTELVGVGSRLLVETLSVGLGDPEPQVGEPVYAHKIGTEDLELHWDQTAEELHRIVRVGGAWTTRHGERFKVHQARPVEPAGQDQPVTAGSLDPAELTVACGAGTHLQLLEVQPAGKPRMAADAWRNGAQPVAGELLGS